MARYLLMLRDAEGAFEGLNDEELRAALDRYRVWSGKLRAEGKIAGGQKLRPGDGRLLRRNGAGVSVTDGPFAEAREVVGGFFVVEAGDYAEAVALANDCPHLDYGSIEVREIEILS